MKLNNEKYAMDVLYTCKGVHHDPIEGVNVSFTLECTDSHALFTNFAGCREENRTLDYDNSLRTAPADIEVDDEVSIPFEPDGQGGWTPTDMKLYRKARI